MPDGRACVGHNIPNFFEARQYHQIGVLNEFLWMCGGNEKKNCRKVLNPHFLYIDIYINNAFSDVILVGHECQESSLGECP